MKEKTTIHILWDGPFLTDELSLLNTSIDYGVYQIYGSHRVNGGDALLYIGLCWNQTFCERLEQHCSRWIAATRNPKKVTFHVGRIANLGSAPNIENWEKMVKQAEQLLLYAHFPCYNSHKYLSEIQLDQLQDVHVLNWDCHRDLFPEVSGARYWRPENLSAISEK